MSHPIKIVEDYEKSPEKNIDNFTLNLMNQKTTLSNSSPTQPNKTNCLISSSTLNKYSDLPTVSNNISSYNENLTEIKENKDKEIETLIKFYSPSFLNENQKLNTKIKIDEEINQKNYGLNESNSFCLISENDNKNQILNNMYIENNTKENKNILIKNINFNNCPNKNIKNNEIKEYFKELKFCTDKIIQTLKLIYENNIFILNPSNDKSHKDSSLVDNSKENKNEKSNKDIIINIDLINLKKENSKEKDFDFYKKNNLPSQEKEKKPFLNKKNNYSKIKNQVINEDYDSDSSNIVQVAKKKNFKRINNRKFNIKSRGFRYNILTEEMKKQLLIDAMNMRTIEVAKKYGISTRNVNRWKKKGIQRKKGSGRKFKDPKLERKILEWYRIQDKETLTSRQFKEKAIELSDNKTFRASSGWLTNMKRKYNLNFKKY